MFGVYVRNTQRGFSLLSPIIYHQAAPFPTIVSWVSRFAELFWSILNCLIQDHKTFCTTTGFNSVYCYGNMWEAHCPNAIKTVSEWTHVIELSVLLSHHVVNKMSHTLYLKLLWEAVFPLRSVGNRPCLPDSRKCRTMLTPCGVTQKKMFKSAFKEFSIVQRVPPGQCKGGIRLCTEHFISLWKTRNVLHTSAMWCQNVMRGKTTVSLLPSL